MTLVEEQTIIVEQARKLYEECDIAGRGYVEKDDLQAAFDLLDPRAVAELEARIGDRKMNEDEFVDAVCEPLNPEVRRSSQSHGSVLLQQSSLSNRSEPSLADEVREAEQDQKLLNDPVVDMLKKQLEESSAYPFSVENTNSDIPTVSKRVTIKKPLFRPIEMDNRPSIAVPAPSLADELYDVESGNERRMSDIPPDRIFKVVFVGDSAVGKTCFLHRFCHNRFKPLFNATIGVDFTVKSVNLGSRTVALQLWDTAGQERFRSITKQYFRKADGVMLMFDVTSEQSFLHVRNWIESVKVAVDESTVMTLIGNKVDLFGDETARSTMFSAARRLAQEFSMPFFETSAYTGVGVELAMRDMTERLQQRELDQLEAALRLEMMPSSGRRSWCCL